MLATPGLASDPHTALHFVEDEQDVILVADAAQDAEPLRAKVIVATFALNRLNDHCGDILTTPLDELLDFRLGALLTFDHVLLALTFRQREVDARCHHPRPG